MIETRTLALVVGTLSLAFGIWAATGAPSEVGLAAGALGFVTGLISLVPRPAQRSDADPTDGSAEPEPGASSDPATATDPSVGSAGTPSANTGAAANTGAPASTAAPAGAVQHTAGYFDRDPADGRPSEQPAETVQPSADPAPHVMAPSANEQPARQSGDEPAGSNGTAVPPPLTDPVTGLFSEDYLVVALEGRLASARRHLRPVAFALLQVTQGLPDTGTRDAEPEVVAQAINDTLRDSDIACRLENGTFGVILEDTPENGAVWTVERIRRNLVSTSGHHTLWAGVACYPAHAFDSGELMAQSRDALDTAMEWNQDRIEVAIAE